MFAPTISSRSPMLTPIWAIRTKQKNGIKKRSKRGRICKRKTNFIRIKLKICSTRRKNWNRNIFESADSCDKLSLLCFSSSAQNFSPGARKKHPTWFAVRNAERSRSLPKKPECVFWLYFSSSRQFRFRERKNWSNARTAKLDFRLNNVVLENIF